MYNLIILDNDECDNLESVDYIMDNLLYISKDIIVCDEELYKFLNKYKHGALCTIFDFVLFTDTVSNTIKYKDFILSPSINNLNISNIFELKKEESIDRIIIISSDMFSVREFMLRNGIDTNNGYEYRRISNGRNKEVSI